MHLAPAPRCDTVINLALKATDGCVLHVQIADAQPTALLYPLITTNSGVSLVFDPLIRKPSEVAAAIVQDITSNVNGNGR